MVRKAIIEKLDKHFPDNDVYGEGIREGFEEPCFFVQILPTNQAKKIQSYKRNELFDIQYFLDEFDEDINEKYKEMGNLLFQILEYLDITDSKKVRGTDMNYQIIDGVLHFNVRYSYILNTATDGLKMSKADVKEMVKDEE